MRKRNGVSVKRSATHQLYLALLMMFAAGIASTSRTLTTVGQEQTKATRVVATEEPLDDVDYRLQGEYQGTITGEWGQPHADTLGLQVCALGNGRFLAAEYPGGLPGNGWNRHVRDLMEVSRNDQRLDIPGLTYHIEVNGSEATVLQYDGTVVGRLSKVLRESPTLGAQPPDQSVVLFDGSSTDRFRNGKINSQGWLEKGTELIETFDDFFLHIEFRLPYMPQDRDQARGNSGVYLLSRYEVQILDSFGLDRRFNHCAALYRSIPPLVNMTLPPLQWQTYDIEFYSPQFDADGKKTKDAQISVRHNGVFVHYKQAIPNKTGAGSPEGPEPLPIKLQDHGDPVFFRNIWLVDLKRQMRN